MTITPLPNVPPSLAKGKPEMDDLVAYLTKLVTMLQAQINELVQTRQQVGRPVQFPLYTKAALLNGPFPLRAGDVPHMCYIPDLNGDPALVISDGTNLRTITIGPPLS